MHEYSIVQSLLESCEEHAKSNGAKKVIKVVVKSGVLSGVEPELLQTAFDTFKEKTICDSAEFSINIQKVEIFCNRCNANSTLKTFVKIVFDVISTSMASVDTGITNVVSGLFFVLMYL